MWFLFEFVETYTFISTVFANNANTLCWLSLFTHHFVSEHVKSLHITLYLRCCLRACYCTMYFHSPHDGSSASWKHVSLVSQS